MQPMQRPPRARRMPTLQPTQPIQSIRSPPRSPGTPGADATTPSNTINTINKPAPRGGPGTSWAGATNTINTKPQDHWGGSNQYDQSRECNQCGQPCAPKGPRPPPWAGCIQAIHNEYGHPCADKGPRHLADGCDQHSKYQGPGPRGADAINTINRTNAINTITPRPPRSPKAHARIAIDTCNAINTPSQAPKEPGNPGADAVNTGNTTNTMNTTTPAPTRSPGLYGNKGLAAASSMDCPERFTGKLGGIMGAQIKLADAHRCGIAMFHNPIVTNDYNITDCFTHNLLWILSSLEGGSQRMLLSAMHYRQPPDL